MQFKNNYITILPSWVLFFLLVVPFVLAGSIPYGVSLAGIILILWLYLVGNSLKVKANLVKGASTRWFNISLLYSAVYIAILDIIFHNSPPKIIIPFHLIAVISIFGALFFVSKLLVASEDKKIGHNKRWFGTFFLFWFFPIGIWFVHPRIKRVLQK
ncbi:MAG: hypothetical protein GY797_18430 [Deltaproteobacteria bacterium]|nr:hypothetical protein [Deltaproteobacteria bacterium]